MACDWVYHIVLVLHLFIGGWDYINYIHPLHCPWYLHSGRINRQNGNPSVHDASCQPLYSYEYYQLNPNVLFIQSTPIFNIRCQDFWTKPIYISYSFPRFPKVFPSKSRFSWEKSGLPARKKLERVSRQEGWTAFHWAVLWQEMVGKFWTDERNIEKNWI